MKVALINGQNHKGSTYHVGRMLAERLAGEENITEIFLPRDMPHFCMGCASCIMEDERLCPHYSSLVPIADSIDSSDVMIFTTPVYVFHASGSMKALLDHFAYRWMSHRPEEKMFSKQGVCISTAAGAGMKSAIKDMRDSLSFWGVAKIYSYGVGVQAISWGQVSDAKKAKIERKVASLAKAVTKRDGKVGPTLKTRLFFYIMRKVNRKPWNPVDGEYWRKKGWLDSARPWKKA